jgi:phosphate transport system substrate-binding protein
VATTKKESAIVSLALLLALVTTPMAANLFVSAPVLSQSPTETPSFPLPQAVENGTTVRIDGSNSLATINQSLKQSFEKQFSGTKVEVAANGTDAALKALLDGQIDVAALGRGLTPEEKAQGLEQVRLYREKIAIIVGTDNPFKGNLTDRQFARIFRGRITDWSQLGKSKGKIRLIDRPATSGIREALSNYPVFRAAKFATGSTATQLTEDNTAEIVKQLGKDGISYALANQVSKLPDVRVLRLHQTLPDNPKYPFSQPLVYVYKKDPSPAIASFLGFTLAQPGKQAIEEARAAEANAIAANSTPSAEATPTATNTPSAEATSAATTTPNAEITPTDTDQQAVVSPAANNPIAKGQIPIWWLLLPLAVMGGLVGWLLRSNLSGAGETGEIPESTPNSPTPTDNTSVAPAPAIAQEIPTNSNFSEGTTPVVSNTAENITSNGSTVLAAGVGAAIGSTVANESSDNQGTKETANLSKYAGITPYELDESPWDIEAPAAVVNTSYPTISDVSPITPTPNVELPTAEVTDVSPVVSHEEIQAAEDLTTEQPPAESNWLEDITATESAIAGTGASVWSTIEVTNDTPEASNTAEQDLNASQEIISDLEWPTEVFSNVTPDEPDTLPVVSEEISPTVEQSSDETGELIADVESPKEEVATSVLEFPDIPEETLNGVADEAELTNNETISNLPEETQDFTQSGLADFVNGAALTGVGIGAWATIYGIQDITGSEAQTPTQSNENLPAGSESAFNLLHADTESSVILTPRTFEWADASWRVSETHKQALRDAGSQLALRLYDVTDMDLSYQNPSLVQQYECEEFIDGRSVPIPTSDRNYVTELGYVADDNNWVTIATSEIVRIFSLPPEDIQDTAVEHTFIENATAFNGLQADTESSVILTPRTFEWADASWRISETHKQALHDASLQLALRLYDVTDMDLSYQSPTLVQQYECEEFTDGRSVPISTSDRDYMTELGYVADDNNWVTLATSEIVRVFSLPPEDIQDTAVEHTFIGNTAAFNELQADTESSIVLKSQTPDWASVSWHVSETHKQALHDAGLQLALRLYDVTDMDLSYQNPTLVQQYDCEEFTDGRSVPISTSDRDYMTELGYVTDGNNWLTLVTSEIVRVFSLPPEDAQDPKVENNLVGYTTAFNSINVDEQSIIILTPRTPKWAYVSWQISETQKQALRHANISQLALRLYDVTDIDLSYQSPTLVQQYECEEATHDRYVAIPLSDHDYIAELGYVTDDDGWVIIARSTAVRVFSRPHGDLWFVADAELIIHGATEPGATVTIAGNPLTLKSDGTFHLRIPFSDNLIEYLITAATANGEQTKTIHKKFFQETPES